MSWFPLRWRRVGALMACAVVFSCAGTPGTDDAGADAGGDAPGDAKEDGAHPPCEVKAPTACPTPAPTYGDVEPIFRERCVVCHYGAVNGPWPLTDYGHVSDWRDDIRTAMLVCSMPPPDQVTEAMPDEERLEILNWIRCGLPE